MLRERVLQRRATIQARLERHRPRRRAPWRRLLLLLLILAWLLLRRCAIDESAPLVNPTPPVPARPQIALAPVSTSQPKTHPPSKSPSHGVRVKLRERATYHAEPPSPPAWIHRLRWQVAARSPRLARCFEGSERPGALRWTASVDLVRGVVSDHEIEPTLALATLTPPLRACLIDVLSSPVYRLPSPAPDPNADPHPPRVSIVIEF